jgi:hypothetical protein
MPWTIDADEKITRHCDHCGAAMQEGFVIADGDEYYCTEPCLHAHVTPEEWERLYDDGEGDSYWTEWEVGQ